MNLKRDWNKNAAFDGSQNKEGFIAGAIIHRQVLFNEAPTPTRWCYQSQVYFVAFHNNYLFAKRTRH